MNREAVALNTPVFTVFEGRLGAVDEELIASGRMRRLSSTDDATLVKRDRRTATDARIRRDPREFTALLLAAVM